MHFICLVRGGRLEEGSVPTQLFTPRSFALQVEEDAQGVELGGTQGDILVVDVGAHQTEE